jgi:hypothetical protein
VTHLDVSAPGGSTAGGTFSITVSALNSSNATISGYAGTVHFSSSDIAAGLPANYTFTTGDAGVHTFTGLVLKTAGNQSITATDTAGSSITGSAAVSVSASTADHLVFAQQPTAVVAGSVISPAVTVKIEDAYNNVLTGDSTDQVTLSLGANPSGGTLGGTTTVTVSGGTATFGNLSINLAGSGYTLVARSAATATGATSAAFSVSAVASSTLLEGFETSPSYFVVGARTPTASISTVAAHDGTYGLVDANGNDWIYRNDGAAQVKQGESISVWMKFSSTSGARAYFGFGSSASGTLSLVAAPNTNQLMLQSNSGYNNYTNLAVANQTYTAGQWYRLEVDWTTGGAITGKIFASNGTTLLQSVTATNTSITSGGFAFRAIGAGNTYWDTVIESSLTGSSNQKSIAGAASAIGASYTGGQLTEPWMESIGAGLSAAASTQAAQASTFSGSGFALAGATTLEPIASASWSPTLEELLIDEQALESLAQARVQRR